LRSCRKDYGKDETHKEVYAEPGEQCTQLQSPPEPVIIEGIEEYVVEKVLAERKHRNKLQYLVKWKHYRLSDASWEPLHKVAGNDAL
jgi:Chromo (CHRromatin Organisation MOdifier) domain